MGLTTQAIINNCSVSVVNRPVNIQCAITCAAEHWFEICCVGTAKYQRCFSFILGNNLAYTTIENKYGIINWVFKS